MVAKKNRFEHGSATVDDFFYWINERHRVFLNRNAEAPFPWTDDKILQKNKFTNPFRQLDKGTVALREMLWGHVAGVLGWRPIEQDVSQDERRALVIWNILWYRLFNWHLNGVNVGFHYDFDEWEKDIRHVEARAQVFTGAHMTWGEPGRAKIDSNVDALKVAWEGRQALADFVQETETMESAFREIKKLPGFGPFISYEVVCDLRFQEYLWKTYDGPTDVQTWANIGPGCKRGLQRLGLPTKLASLRWLHQVAQDARCACACGLTLRGSAQATECSCAIFHEWTPDGCDRGGLGWHLIHHHPGFPAYWRAERERLLPFELREIEHSLCEFDKYMRIKEGGRARSKFRWKGKV